MVSELTAVFNRAYEEALRGPTATLAIHKAVEAVAAAERARIVAEVQGRIDELEERREAPELNQRTAFELGERAFELRLVLGRILQPPTTGGV